MSGLTLRSYVAADEAACASIFRRAWRTGLPFAPRNLDVAEFRAETEGECIFVGEIDSIIAGFVSLYEPDCFVHHLYVDPAWQGRGVGTALLEHAMAMAGGRVSLKCQTRNLTALAFYRRRGWAEGEAGESEFGAWVRLLSPR